MTKGGTTYKTGLRRSQRTATSVKEIFFKRKIHISLERADHV